MEAEQTLRSANRRNGLLKKAGVVAGFTLAGVGIGNAVGNEAEIASLRVKTQMTIGADSTFGLGAENIRYDSGLPLNLGIHIEPQTLSSEAFGSELRKVGDVELAISEIAPGHLRHLGKYGLIAGAYGGVIALSTGNRKNSNANRIIASTAAAFSTALGVGLPSYELASQNWQTINNGAFAGQLPEGMAAKLSVSSDGVLMTQVAEAIDKNERFYDEAKASALKAIKPIIAYSKEANTEMIPLETDWHCRLGMARVSGAIADAVEAKMVLNAGDLVSSGVSEEQWCVETYSHHVAKDEREIVIAPGNHDNPVNVEDMRQAGWKVLDGRTIEVDGINIFGDSDPRVDMTARPNSRRDDDESNEQFKNRISRAVAIQNPDVVLIHDKKFVDKDSVGNDTIVLSGHMHKLAISPDGHWVQGGTVGGKKENTMSYYNGLDTDARLQILHYDKNIKKFTALHVITIDKQAKATVSDVIPLSSSANVEIAPQLMK